MVAPLSITCWKCGKILNLYIEEDLSASLFTCPNCQARIDNPRRRDPVEVIAAHDLPGTSFRLIAATILLCMSAPLLASLLVPGTYSPRPWTYHPKSRALYIIVTVSLMCVFVFLAVLGRQPRAANRNGRPSMASIICILLLVTSGPAAFFGAIFLACGGVDLSRPQRSNPPGQQLLEAPSPDSAPSPKDKP
jgi:hypothetical protein